MSRTRPSFLLAGAMIGALALTGCGAGQIASTAEQVANAPGANTTVGPIAVRDAVIVFGESVEGGSVYATGGSAPLSMTIVNESGEEDRLVAAAVSPDLAESVQVTGDAVIPGGRSLVVEGESFPVPLPSPVGVPAPAPTTTPAPPVAPTSAPAAEEGVSIVLTGLREDIRAGVSYPVVLIFEKAGEVTVDVPVGTTDEPREEAEEAE